jgi:hypothetical protein
MHRNDIAVSRRSQSDQTQVEGSVGKGWIIFKLHFLSMLRNRALLALTHLITTTCGHRTKHIATGERP